MKLVQSVPTRWNSIFDMIESIIINKTVLISLSLERDNGTMKKNVPSENEFIILNDLCLLLQPLKETSIIFSGSSYNTISLLYPSIYYLINTCLNELNFTNETIDGLHSVLIESLRKRFRFVFNNNLFPASTFLNHKYRKFEFIKDLSIRRTIMNNAKSYIVSKFNVQTEDSSFTSAQPTSTSTPLRNVTNSSQNVTNSSQNISVLSSSSISSSSTSFNSSQKKKKNFLSKLVDKQPIHVITAEQSELEQEIANSSHSNTYAQMTMMKSNLP